MKGVQLDLFNGFAKVVPLHRHALVPDTEDLKARIIARENSIPHGVCSNCPLWHVCDEDCGYNGSNGYRPGRVKFNFKK